MNRSFRLVPKRTIRKAIAFCLAVVLEDYRDQGKIRLYEYEFMGNHYHLLGEDITGCLPDFIRDLNSLISMELNSIRGISDSNFSRKPYGLVQVHGEQRLVDHAVYTLANPVAAFLVTKSKHWRGCSSLNLEYGVGVKIPKPKVGMWSGEAKHAGRASSKRSKRAAFANRSILPEEATLTIDRPPVLMHLSDTELRQHIRDRLAQREDEVANQRQRRGIRVMGRRNAEAVHYLALPKPEEMFARNPTFSAENKKERKRLAKIYVAFVEAYRKARDLYYASRGKADVDFPEGTFLLRKRPGVRCVPLVVP
jgi:hypothetical protein